MRSGLINKTVELWKKTVDGDNFGNTDTWEFSKYLKSYTARRSGRHVLDSDEVFDLIKVRIQIRNQHDIDETDRIKYFGNMYMIEFIQPDITERWLTVHCTRINE